MAVKVVGRDSEDTGAPVAPFYARVDQYIRDPSIWADLERVHVDLLDGSPIVIHDVMFLAGDLGAAGATDYAVFAFAGPDDAPGRELIGGVPLPDNAKTSMCGGAVFVRKLKQLAAIGPENEGRVNRLPILGKIVRRVSPNFPTPYYDLQ